MSGEWQKRRRMSRPEDESGSESNDERGAAGDVADNASRYHPVFPTNASDSWRRRLSLAQAGASAGTGGESSSAHQSSSSTAPAPAAAVAAVERCACDRPGFETQSLQADRTCKRCTRCHSKPPPVPTVDAAGAGAVAQPRLSIPPPRLHGVTEPVATDTLELVITNLSGLRHKFTSNYKMIANLPWRLAAKSETSKRTNNLKYFSVYIDCNPESEATIWSCDAIVEFRLQSQSNNSVPDYTKQFTNKFNFSSNNWGFPSFIQWADILNPEKGYIKNDRVILSANITVVKTAGIRVNPQFDFTDPSNPTSDVVLLIDGVHLYVSKAYLALYSPVFRAMFYGRFQESNQQEVPVQDVILDEFVELLHVVYPSHKPVNDQNVEFLLELGDKFEVQYVIEECEKFLMKNEGIPVISKLLWADQYSLSNLQNVCIHTFKSLTDIKNLKVTEEWKSLSDSTKAALLEKAFKLM